MKRIQVASIKKRILSSLIDLSLIAGLFCLFYFCVFSKVVSKARNYSHLNDVITQEKLNSKLYIKENNKIISLLEKNPKSGESELKEPTEYFYTNYLQAKDEKYTKYWYHVHVLYLDDVLGTYQDEQLTKPEIVLFDWVDPTNPVEVKKKIEHSQNEFDDFYHASYASATVLLRLTDPIKSAVISMTWGNIRATLYSSLIATLIPCFIVPIALKNGKTVGKLITKLVVLTDDGYEYKRYKHIFRYLAFYIFEVFGGVVTIGLTLILTTSLTLFSKKRRALHDYIAFSMVADETYSVFYKDEQEEADYQIKSEAKLVA